MPPAHRRYATPLRYPGGKAKLANFIKLIYQQNKLLDGHYAETYAGGAGVALSLLFLEYASEIHINDLSKPVYAFWHSVLYETEEFCDLIRGTQITIEEWHRQKAIQGCAETASLLELGFSTFFLNRTNRSGIITGGVIGGKGQSGVWKMDARFNKSDLIDRIKKIARYRRRINLYNEDASDFLRTILPNLPARTLCYLDPPYFVKGQGLYEDYYQAKDHAEIARLISQITHPWIVSYDNAPEIAELYKSYRSVAYNLSYSAADRYRGAEIMFFSEGLIIPSIQDPTAINQQMLSPYQNDFQWA
jgi:DNA adenine methylase